MVSDVFVDDFHQLYTGYRTGVDIVSKQIFLLDWLIDQVISDPDISRIPRDQPQGLSHLHKSAYANDFHKCATGPAVK